MLEVGVSLVEFVAFEGGDKYRRSNSDRSARIFLAPWSGGAGRERGGGGGGVLLAK